MYSYHIKDSFFTDIEQALGTKNTHLMSNKENEGYRPHFLCVKDARNPDIYWAVSQSTKVEKYKNQIKIKKRKIWALRYNCDWFICTKRKCIFNSKYVSNYAKLH